MSYTDSNPHWKTDYLTGTFADMCTYGYESLSPDTKRDSIMRYTYKSAKQREMRLQADTQRQRQRQLYIDQQYRVTELLYYPNPKPPILHICKPKTYRQELQIETNK